jgi:hypothetical protein
LAEPRLVHLNFRRVKGREYFWVGFGHFCEWFQRETIRTSSSK